MVFILGAGCWFALLVAVALLLLIWPFSGVGSVDCLLWVIWWFWFCVFCGFYGGGLCGVGSTNLLVFRILLWLACLIWLYCVM